MSKALFKKILTDVRFWLLLFFALRLIGVTNAPLEVGHNWRQSLTNMIARNFSENCNIFYPTIDMAGEKTGIIGSEFPFYNYLIYLANIIFDSSHWIGRFINLIISSFGLYYFFKLLRALFSRQVAFNATIVLTVSIWFAFSRKIMPDTFSVSLVIIGLYHALTYLKSGLKYRLALFFVFTTLGILSKIPALSLFSVLAIVIFYKEIECQRKAFLFLTGVLSFFIVCLWYFYWVPYLLDTYQYQLYFPKGIIEGINEIIPLAPELFKRFYFSALHSYIALVCFLGGVFVMIQKKQSFFIAGITIVTFVFLLFVIKTGAVFPLHNYYIIPFVPVMALLAGVGITYIPVKFQYILLGLIIVEGIANQQHDFRIAQSQKYKLKLDSITKEFVPRKSLIVINGGQSPQDIYFANRRGWTLADQNINNQAYIDSLLDLGAEYIILDITHTNQKFPQYKKLYSDNHYSIFALEQKSD